MTDKLIMTTAERDEILHALSVPEHADEGENAAAIALLQSLPVVDSEPCNEDLATDIETIDAMHRGDPCYEHDAYYMRDAAAKLVRKGYPLFASPQALTPITADDVPDSLCFSTGEDKEKISEIYNAVIKHKVTK